MSWYSSQTGSTGSKHRSRWNIILAIVGLSIAFQIIFYFDVGSSRTAIKEQIDNLRHKLSAQAGSSTDSTTASSEVSGIDMKPVNSDDPREQKPIVICVAVKDQVIDIPEWLVHHYTHMNISHFYIEDHGSDPPLENFEFPGVPREALSFHYYSKEEADAIGDKDFQTHIYESCAARIRNDHKWVAFIDIDEFLEVKNGETLASVLHEFEQDDTIGAVGINWKVHTSDGQLVRQESVRKAFNTCIWNDDEHNGDDSDNRVVKSIVRLDRFDRASTPHVFYTTPNEAGVPTWTVGEDGKPWTDTPDPFTLRAPITHNRLALHHYTLKSKAEFEEKIHRWPAGLIRAWNYWDKLELENEHVACPEMSFYNP